MALHLKGMIDDLCWKAGVAPKEVELIEIYPTTVRFTMRQTHTGPGTVDRTIREIDYVYEDEPSGDQEEG